MQERMVPQDGVNPYASHPGFDAQGCPLQYTVTQRGPWGDIGHCGFGCRVTGGHCLPGDHCAELRAKNADLFQPNRLAE